MHSVTTTLLLTHDGIAALEKLIAMRKTEHPNFTKTYVSKKLGLSSRAFLTDVLKGRKNLSARVVKPLVDLLKLDKTQSELLEKKLLLSTEFAKAEEVKKQLESDIHIIQKQFQQQSLRIDQGGDVYSLSLVYLSFYLYPEKKAKLRQLIQSLPLMPVEVLQKNLQYLLLKGLLIEADHVYSLHPERDFSYLHAELEQNDECQYLKKSLQESQQYLDLWQAQRDDMLFHSSILTVRKEHYREILKQIREDFRRYHASLDQPSPDMLVRFNIQSYPLHLLR